MATVDFAGFLNIQPNLSCWSFKTKDNTQRVSEPIFVGYLDENSISTNGNSMCSLNIKIAHPKNPESIKNGTAIICSNRIVLIQKVGSDVILGIHSNFQASLKNQKQVSLNIAFPGSTSTTMTVSKPIQFKNSEDYKSYQASYLQYVQTVVKLQQAQKK